jgi:hypothetical protein
VFDPNYGKILSELRRLIYTMLDNEKAPVASIDGSGDGCYTRAIAVEDAEAAPTATLPM